MGDIFQDRKKLGAYVLKHHRKPGYQGGEDDIAGDHMHRHGKYHQVTNVFRRNFYNAERNQSRLHKAP